VAKRSLDIIGSSVALVLLGPSLAVAALGIRLCSPGDVLHRARRVGKGGAEFTMYKLRTMHARSGGGAITAPDDPRVFPFGAWLRRLKFDEVPQFYNILRGDMSIVGPRPEDPGIVREHYTPAHMETLAVRPGLTSPGTLYYYTQSDRILTEGDAERRYVEELLPVKLDLEWVYIRQQSFTYDLTLMIRTLVTMFLLLLGKKRFADPPELTSALRLLASADSETRLELD
jgi:lipopolysaccharide/colanic/teichoic acid biosynthesis glycosyltransferase